MYTSARTKISLVGLAAFFLYGHCINLSSIWYREVWSAQTSQKQKRETFAALMIMQNKPGDELRRIFPLLRTHFSVGKIRKIFFLFTHPGMLSELIHAFDSAPSLVRLPAKNSVMIRAKKKR